jgi:aminoglycoside phosphotransferase family enzyme/predicted kinase
MLPGMVSAAYYDGATWGFPGAAVEHLETHAAHVFLAGDRAFKIKKDVRLPYLDFSSVEKRRKVLEDELAINRRFNPDLYLEVSHVAGEPVLVMRRFDSGDMLSWHAANGGIDDALARALAAMMAEAHRLAPRRDAPGADIMAGLGAQLSSAFTRSADLFPPSQTLDFHALFEDALRRLKVLLNRRNAAGLVRRCHGDAHCKNIVVRDGQPQLFDAIEFSEAIATIDVLYDLAFLLMDLMRRGADRAANQVLNRYLHLRRGAEDLSGLAALPLFLATRAGVRALVMADLVHELPPAESLRQRGDALDYFRMSLGFLRPPPPLLIAIGGLSGCGKTTVASGIAPHLGAAPGALHLRTDVERKILFGVSQTEMLPAASYTREASAAVYRAMLDRAEAALGAGHAVILDAVFAQPGERQMAEGLARRLGVGFHGFWLEADADTLKARVRARHGDASDATAEVVDKQLAYALGDIAWPRIDAGGTAEQAMAAIRERLPSRSGGPA